MHGGRSYVYIFFFISYVLIPFFSSNVFAINESNVMPNGADLLKVNIVPTESMMEGYRAFQHAYQPVFSLLARFQLLTT